MTATWRRYVVILFIAGSVFFLFVKLFLLQVDYPEVATTALIVKPVPSLTSYLSTDEIPANLGVIVHDDHGYPGEDLYQAIVTWLWLVYPLLGVGFGIYCLRRYWGSDTGT